METNMQKIVKAEDLRKVEVGAIRKRLDGLLAKPFLTDAEQQLRDTLSKRLADGVSEAAFEQVFQGPRFRLNTI